MKGNLNAGISGWPKALSERPRGFFQSYEVIG